MSGLARMAARAESLHDLPESSAKSCSCGGLLRTSDAIWASTRARASRTFFESAAPGSSPRPESLRRMSRTCSRESGVKRFCRAAPTPATVVLVSGARPSFARMLARFCSETPPPASALRNASFTATARFGSMATALRDERVTWLLTFLRPVTSPFLLVLKSIWPAL